MFTGAPVGKLLSRSKRLTMPNHVSGPDLNQVRTELHEALRIHGEGRMSVHGSILRALAILDGKDPDSVSRFKVLVTGSRDWTDYDSIACQLADLKDHHGDFLVIQGGARGADSLAATAARRSNLHCAEIDALWTQRGERAGGDRNRAMLDLEPDLVLAFPLPGSKGTWDCVNEAKRRGIPVEVHDGR